MTYYFYTGFDSYSGLHLYLFNSVTHEENATFPGAALSSETVKNASGKDCYVVEVDRNVYDSFILVAWENSDQKQTDDVAFSDYASSNMFSFDPAGWHDTGSGWKCSIAAETYASHVHSYDANTHLCVCGEAEIGYAAITFVVNYDTKGDGDIYLVGLHDNWTPSEGYKMTWTSGNNWVITLALKVGEQVAFKYVQIHSNDSVTWEGGSNHLFTPTTTAIYDEGWH